MMSSFESLLPSGHHKTQCLEDNLEFVMLNEILRAKSQELVTLLSAENPDIQTLRRHALDMKLSTQSLMRDEVLVHPRSENETRKLAGVSEPASLQSVIEMATIALKHRLSALKIPFFPPAQECDDRFIWGNPYEISYALFILCLRIGHTQSNIPLREKNETGLHVGMIIENDFVDISLTSPVPLFPIEEIDESHSPVKSLLNSNEWFCMQKLLSRNNTHIQLQVSETSNPEKHNIIMRLPTFHPGHEEPLDFLTMNDSP